MPTIRPTEKAVERGEDGFSPPLAEAGEVLEGMDPAESQAEHLFYQFKTDWRNPHADEGMGESRHLTPAIAAQVVEKLAQALRSKSEKWWWCGGGMRSEFSDTLDRWFAWDDLIAERALMKCEGVTIRGSVFIGDSHCMRPYVRQLPDHLTAPDSLWLTDCERLESLPRGLKVGQGGGSLSLTGCVSLRALPDDLCVHGELFLNGCTAWDGIIPEGVDITGRIYTDAYPRGLTLKEWRERHGFGTSLGDPA